MKTTFAAIVGVASAINSTVEPYVEQQPYGPNYDNGYTGPIAPESFGYAVNDWDINEPTIDDECYAHQVDIYSDQIVAIEATRVILSKLIKRVEWAEEEIEDNAQEIADNREEIRENDWETRANEADIEELRRDIDDIEECLYRQKGMQRQNRAVIELYCHSQAYVAWIMDECKYVLVDGTKLQYGIDWSYNEYPAPQSSPHAHPQSYH